MATTTRRSFITTSLLGITGLSLSSRAGARFNSDGIGSPVVISTWEQGMQANDAAWEIISAGGYSVDAVETGIRLAEADPGLIAAGYGAVPNARGKVTLDACIMNEKGNAGSVALLECIKHPVSVARLVMEQSSHAMLAGKGAQQFALANGFEKEKLLTKEMRRCWRKWKKEKQESSTKMSFENQQEENHPTISMLCVDEKGRLSGACSTSGLAFEMHGSVGHASIVGAGLYVDGETGGAAATGSGDYIMKTLGSYLIVEFMRGGMSPEEACNAAIARIVKESLNLEEHQVGFVAISKSGEIGAASLHPGFNYAVKTNYISELKEAGAWFKKL